jgi:poly(A) polymerase
VAALKRFLAGQFSDDARTLLAALSSQPSVAERIAWLAERFAEVERTDVAPPPLLTGDDLVAAGMTPGPAFKRILDDVYNAQLEGQISTREAALALASSRGT